MDAFTSNLGMDGLNTNQKEQVLEATSAILDRALEDENEKLDAILNDEDELMKMRKKRLAQMKAEQEQKGKWKNQGHGKLQELDDQKEFFRACEGSERVVAIFSTPNNAYGAELIEHLSYIATKHPETRFIKLDAEKSPFLVDKLKIWMIPSVMLIKNEKAVHTLQGLDEISVDGKYQTWHVERALNNYEMLEHQDIEDQVKTDNLDDRDDL